jgi:hypothetical protein
MTDSIERIGLVYTPIFPSAPEMSVWCPMRLTDCSKPLSTSALLMVESCHSAFGRHSSPGAEARGLGNLLAVPPDEINFELGERVSRVRLGRLHR